MSRRVDIRVIEERLPRGYIGPCEQRDCDKPADCTLFFTVNGVRAHTWTCREHRAEVTGEPGPA